MNQDITALSFEDAIRELESIVRQLEEGRVPLEQAIQSYERGTALKKLCQEKLKQAKMRVDQIQLDETGAPTSLAPSDLQGHV